MKKIYLAILLSSTFLLSGCGDDEKKARKLLNQAIQQWDAGQLEAADALFQQIESNYIDTAVATEAIKERQARKKQYQENINLEQVKQLNQGRFSKIVVRALNDYQQKHKQYPNTLNSLKLSKDKELSPLLTGCTYKKALFNAGYSLNCLEADSQFKRQQRSKKRSEREKKREMEKTHGKPLSSFPKAKKTFAAIMNPENAVPKSGFFAYYFRMSKPNKIVFREQVSDITINYAWDDFHQIDSKEFGGYWVGEIYFEKPVIKNVSVDLSWSSARVMVDKHIIYDGKNSSKTIPVAFPAGKHLIEVEYSNGWHTTEFSVSFTDKKETLSAGDVKKYLRENKTILGDYDLFYAGTYESNNKDLSIPLNILPNDKPIVLMLSSYSVVKWVINNPHNVEIKAIIFNGSSKGTEVRNAGLSTKVLGTKAQLGGYELGVKCECHPNAHFRCNYDSGITKQIEQLTEHKLNGFSGTYGTKAFDIPDIALNDGLRDVLELNDQKIRKQRQACTKKYNPNFENILQEYQ